MALIVFICLITACPALAYQIDGNKVYIDDAKAYISAEPHTLHESGWVYFNIISKTYSGDVDIAFGFDIENVQPKKAERLNGGNWVNIADKFDSIYWTHDNLTKWYYAKNIPVVAGTTYMVRVWLNIPVSNIAINGKYGVVIKASSQTLQQAKNAGNLYYLDPWFDVSWQYKTDNAIADGVRPYQISLNISNSIGTNNATQVYCNGHCNANFTDIRFTLDDTTALSYWIENNTTGKVWVNVTANGTVNMYYGNHEATSQSDGNATFPQFQGETSTDFQLSNIAGTDDFRMHIKYLRGSATNEYIGLSNIGSFSADDSIYFGLNAAYIAAITTYNEGLYSQFQVNGVGATTNIYDVEKTSTSVKFYRDSVLLGTITTTIPNENMGLRLQGGSSNTWFYGFISPYSSLEPDWAIWGEEGNSLFESWGNNYTNNQNKSISLFQNQNINFNITSRYGDPTNWYLNGVNQSNHYNNISIAFTSMGAHSVTAYVTNASTTQNVTWDIVLNMQLLTPANETTLYNPYPPSAPQITFTWTSSGFPFYNLLISTDPYFNYIVASNYYSTETANVYLLSDTKYYWKVRTYLDALTPGDYSVTYWFNLTSNYSVSGKTGIAGTVYEKKATGELLPISGAVVYIRNEALNWSSTASTGVNGYYLFDNLTNTTVYSLNAKSTGYEDSATEYVTTVPGQQVIKNIMLSKCISGFNCFYNQQYVKFKVQTLFGTKYPGVAISVYKGTELTASDTGTTGTDGSATFLLIKDQQYRITFVSATFGINREITIIPINTEYIIIITALDTGWEDYNTSIKNTIFMDVSKTIIDDTHANINVSYLDLLGETTAVTVYLNQTNVSDPHNQTVIDSWTTTGNGTHNFSISPYSGQQYLIHFKAEHSTYGNLEKTYSIFFEKVAGIPGIPTIALSWFAIICVVLTAAAFTKSTAELGAILACGEGWIFLMIGFLTPIGNTTTIATGLTLASVVSVLAYLSTKSKESGYS